MIGVVGGGQLAQMLVQAANQRSIPINVQTSSKSDPAAKIANEVILSDPNNLDGTKTLAKKTKAITFENEWVDIEGLSRIKDQGVSFFPDVQALAPLVDKLSQRELLQSLDIPSPEWIPILTTDFSSFKLPSGWKFPLMAKTARGGYDGKGTRIIRDSKDFEQLFSLDNSHRWFLEKWVEYEKELSLVVSRDENGIIRFFPIAETSQMNQVCDWVIAPAEVSHPVEVMAQNIAASLMSELNYVGVMAIEFFYGAEGLIVNEIAPRTHNSGHFSIEACNSSQFDQQLCITAGLPVPSPSLIAPGALMVNLLGLPKTTDLTIKERLDSILSLGGIELHWYEKEHEAPGRKLGHVTFLLTKEDSTSRRLEAFDVIKQIREIWPMS